MSEEESVSDIQSDTTVASDTPTQETVTETVSDKPAGYDPVDPTTASPEQVQERINYLYSQVKDNRRSLTDYRKIAAEQSRLINELQNGMGTVVNHLQEKTLGETEAQLTSARNAAYEAGDTKAYHEAQDKLDNLRLEKKFNAAQKKQPVQQPQRQPVEDTGYDDPEVESYVDSWQAEKAETGQLLRPWAFGSHPKHQEALIETEAVMKNPRFANLTMQQKLAEVDRRMGVTKMTNKQTVIGGSFTGARKTSKLSLSPEQEKLAIRTKFGGPKATDAESIDAYRKQLEKSQQRKGTR